MERPVDRVPVASSAPRTSLSQKPSDVRVVGVELYFLPVPARTPLKFGSETLTSVTCARVRAIVADRQGRTMDGWGETPLSVQWTWPCNLPYRVRDAALQHFCRQLAVAWAEFEAYGHALEVGEAFVRTRLGQVRERFNRRLPPSERMPALASLVCCSAFDVAVHDAFARLLQLPVYDTYGPEHMNCDLSHFLESADDEVFDFRGLYPESFLQRPAATTLPVWHLVGGLDPLSPEELTPESPVDAHPVLLTDWIRRDGLKCLKIKLRGDDEAWDYDRVIRVGRLAGELGVEQLTTDFNCMVREPSYVMRILDRLRVEHPVIHAMILYVEQPFPYDMEACPIDVRDLVSRKPLLMDESADDWRHVRLGRSLGWNGVALKTCKTQTGALLSLCWAKAHGMHVMVQDLTNPMLAQIPHVQLAAHAATMRGVESNAMQFYPDASAPEAEIHPGLYRRREGRLDLSSLRGPGFGYRVEEIARTLPAPVLVHTAAAKGSSAVVPETL
ncbi:MAG: mandelate racemase/muconate lactonizing enzyme family protein [Pirellulales bacterium]|nr:mandelate racemase/muconate lactonizing enzyme family protein [Pirellulales bacterium]